MFPVYWDSMSGCLKWGWTGAYTLYPSELIGNPHKVTWYAEKEGDRDFVWARIGSEDQQWTCTGNQPYEQLFEAYNADNSEQWSSEGPWNSNGNGQGNQWESRGRWDYGE